MKKRPQESHDEYLHRFVMKHLREKSLHWYARTEAKNAARVERGRYKCASCENLFKNGEFEMDHTVPVVSTVKQNLSLEEKIKRLLSPPSNWSVLCITCHESKTLVENATRDAFRAEKRKLDKKIKKEAKKLAKKS